MLELHFFRNEKERIIEGLRKRNYSDEALSIIEEIVNLDNQRKATQTELDQTLAQINSLSKEIGDLFKSGSAQEANSKKEEVSNLKIVSKDLEIKLDKTKEELETLLISVPNIPYHLVASGTSAEDNTVYKDLQGSIPALPEDALPHWEIAEKYKLFSLKLGVQLTGSGFPVYTGQGAKLQRALISFFLDEAAAAGYHEIIPPLLVNKDTARATGQLPDKEGQMYYMEKDDLYLIPTAEVPITNIYRDQILNVADFPIKMAGYTPCFRREAGSYGADVKGLNRVHQFDKIEIVQIEHPDKSYDTLHQMVAHVEGLLQKLELPYRILRLCGGDMSFGSAMTYDFEVFSAAQKRWLEVSSVSNFETFQSNRMMLRFKDEQGKMRLAHTLNGSALALARIVAAILENYQTPEGISIPNVLRPYTKFDLITI